ncbi:hypothetical protein K9L67_00485 [Candidatus Woesearchaeota archaeon]|nr:hypothetical protein [Candidatus Woesearchaeota archaeon]MCF7900683.1 hypothetical protein [Candidatus Woesearchaeota archaeon]MCF8013205.1 hypothetical protein [Candidatus Woesearchaeota archaeon]
MMKKILIPLTVYAFSSANMLAYSKPQPINTPGFFDKKEIEKQSVLDPYYEKQKFNSKSMSEDTFNIELVVEQAQEDKPENYTKNNKKQTHNYKSTNQTYSQLQNASFKNANKFVSNKNYYRKLLKK